MINLICHSKDITNNNIRTIVTNYLKSITIEDDRKSAGYVTKCYPICIHFVNDVHITGVDIKYKEGDLHGPPIGRSRHAWVELSSPKFGVYNIDLKSIWINEVGTEYNRKKYQHFKHPSIIENSSIITIDQDSPIIKKIVDYENSSKDAYIPQEGVERLIKKKIINTSTMSMKLQFNKKTKTFSNKISIDDAKAIGCALNCLADSSCNYSMELRVRRIKPKLSESEAFNIAQIIRSVADI